jgi:hypothetical protein
LRLRWLFLELPAEEAWALPVEEAVAVVPAAVEEEQGIAGLTFS